MSRPSSSDVSALILAGGRATRLGGVAKHELIVGGETILARQVRLLGPRVAEILVSSPRDVAGFRTVRDAREDVGPLAGIAAGLAACATPWLVVIAGDMPDVTDDLLARLLDARVDPSGARRDAVGVRSGGLPEPLLCALHRRVRPVVDVMLGAKRQKASGLLTDEGLAVGWIDADPDVVRSINAPEDLA